jgi:hypothetical protein
MKKEKIIVSSAVLLVILIITGCENKNIEANETEGDLPYLACPHEGEYLDTVKLVGEAYLFNDSVPDLAKIELQEKRTTSDFVAWIIYNQDIDVATLYTSSSKEESSSIICNYPEFAKHWNISLNGQNVHFEGTMYKTGEYLSVPPIVGYDMILTLLKKK